MTTIKDKALKKILFFVVISVFLVPVLETYITNPAFTRLIVQNSEDEAIRTAYHLSHMLIAPETDTIDRSILTPELVQSVKLLARDFKVMKLKIFHASGEIIYSTDADDIGQMNTREYFQQVVAKGKVHTMMVKKDGTSLEGQHFKTDVVETYVPIMKEGRFIGALELYYDISKQNRALRNVLYLSYILPLALAAMLIILLTSILVRLDKMIAERLQASEALEKALDNEIRHSLELWETNRQLEKTKKKWIKATEVTAVMEERERLARELHDSVTQSLYSLTLFSETGRKLVEKKEFDRLEECLHELGQTARATLKEMRLLIYDLRPSTLERDGLFNALQQRIDMVEQRAGVKGQLIIESGGKVSMETEGGLYRIAQEALNNSLKHSRATLVNIIIRINEDFAEMEVQDNGIGFDPDNPEIKGGLGLVNISERAKKLGGWMKIYSAPGCGTHIKVKVQRYPDKQEEE